MDGKYLLRKDSNPNEFGEYRVILQYCTQGISVKKATGISVRPDHWLGDKGDGKYVKGGKDGHPKAVILNQRLVNLIREIDDKINKLLVEKNQVIPVPILRSILNGTYDKEKEKLFGAVPFVDFVLQHNRELYLMGKIGYSVWDNIICYMRKFEEFLQEKGLDKNDKTTLYCKDLTVPLIKDYIKWRQEKKNSNGTINKALTPIFKAVKVICRKDWIDRDTCDEICNLYFPSNAKDLDAETTHYLTEEQIKKLKAVVEESKYPRTKDFFDMFMFSVYTGGLRFSDVATLRWEEIDIERKMIKHIQVKGHTKNAKMLTIPISDGSMNILEKWRGRNANFVFGILDDEFDLGDCEHLKETLNAKDRSINTSLKTLGEKIGLPFSLHFHISRHTFASIGLNAGVDVKTISALMGHSSVLVTEKVYASVLPSTLEQVVQEKLNFNF